MEIKKKITAAYQHAFTVQESGMAAIFVSARCKSKDQIKSNTDEDLRVEINHAPFRELPPISIEEKAEDGDRRPWYGFVLVDLPLKRVSVKAGIQYRWPDSDDIKLIIDGDAYEQEESTLHRFWIFAGSLLRKVLRASADIEKTFEVNLLPSTHYVELHADKTPVLHGVRLDVFESESKAQIRARRMIKEHTGSIKTAAEEFGVDPVVVAGVIYQEQSTNVNFVDTLADYIGGLLFVNTSIGIGQVRVSTAQALETHHPSLNPALAGKSAVLHNAIRIEFLKDPLMNIRYVAAKVAFDQKRWKEAGFDISDRPDILGTLYNIEDVKNPKKEPHANPDSNDFGKGVAENYDAIKRWLGI